MKKPKKWTEVYPQGTKEGNEEQKFFIALGRHPKYDWRTTGMIEKETGLPRKRIEEIIQKYLKAGIIFQSPSDDNKWGYWERVPQMLKDDGGTISQKDQDQRIDKHVHGDAEAIVCGAQADPTSTIVVDAAPPAAGIPGVTGHAGVNGTNGNGGCDGDGDPGEISVDGMSKIKFRGKFQEADAINRNPPRRIYADILWQDIENLKLGGC